MKKNIYAHMMIIGFCLSVFMVVGQVNALQNSSLMQLRDEKRRTILETMQEKKQNLQITGAQIRKEKSYQEIERRIAHLEELITRLNAIKRLTDTQKADLISQVQAEIDKLKSLKSQIESETDPVKIKELKQSIVTSYRIYVVFMPKIQIMAHADRILTVAEEMKQKTTDEDALSKISEAETKANEAINAVIGLTPDGYPGNKATFQSARQMLTTALQYLKDARLLMIPASNGSSSSSSSSI